jgi:hypothetical protein
MKSLSEKVRIFLLFREVFLKIAKNLPIFAGLVSLF